MLGTVVENIQQHVSTFRNMMRIWWKSAIINTYIVEAKKLRSLCWKLFIEAKNKYAGKKGFSYQTSLDSKKRIQEFPLLCQIETFFSFFRSADL